VCRHLSNSTAFLDHHVHKTIVLNRKERETNDDLRKIKDKIKHSGDNEDPTNHVVEK
jgi:hypothetical protein